MALCRAGLVQVRDPNDRQHQGHLCGDGSHRDARRTVTNGGDSRRFPVERVDLCGADVAQEHRGVIRCQGKPRAPSSGHAPEVLQAHHPLHLTVIDPHAKDGRIGWEWMSK